MSAPELKQNLGLSPCYFIAYPEPVTLYAKQRRARGPRGRRVQHIGDRLAQLPEAADDHRRCHRLSMRDLLRQRGCSSCHGFVCMPKETLNFRMCPGNSRRNGVPYRSINELPSLAQLARVRHSLSLPHRQRVLQQHA